MFINVIITTKVQLKLFRSLNLKQVRTSSDLGFGRFKEISRLLRETSIAWTHPSRFLFWECTTIEFIFKGSRERQAIPSISGSGLTVPTASIFWIKAFDKEVQPELATGELR